MPRKPLLVSVRSGARVSMPGMMDTVLNLGLNDETVEGLARRSGDRRFAYDSYRRFIQMYSDVVLGVEHHQFEDISDEFKDAEGHGLDTGSHRRGLDRAHRPLQALVVEKPASLSRRMSNEQLWGAIGGGVQVVAVGARRHLSATASAFPRIGARR